MGGIDTCSGQPAAPGEEWPAGLTAQGCVREALGHRKRGSLEKPVLILPFKGSVTPFVNLPVSPQCVCFFPLSQEGEGLLVLGSWPPVLSAELLLQGGSLLSGNLGIFFLI